MCEYCGDNDHVILELKDLGINTDEKLEKAIDILNKASGERLYANPDKVAKEVSPYKSVRDLELRSKTRVELLLYELYTQIDKHWLHFEKAQDDYSPFKLNNKTYINPRTGQPLTKKEWKQIREDINKALGYIYDREEERLVKTAMALGKILNTMEIPEAIHTPYTVLNVEDRADKILDTDADKRALAFAEEYTGQNITDLTQKQYTKIHNVIVSAQKNHLSTEELSTQLFDTFSDLNKDWRRIAETEIAGNVNSGQLIAELNRNGGEVAFVKGVSSGGACQWCSSKVDGKVFAMVSTPPVNGDQVNIEGTFYTALWAGKDNVGRKRADWWVSATTQHPHCRCTFVGYNPEFKDWHAELQNAIDEATKETQAFIIPELIMDEEPLFIQEMRKKRQYQ